jgi:threonine dehydrogenase-like Zn-dependent dehydrogenase
MKALRFDGRLEFTTEAPSPAREGEALVEVLCAGICNTDLEIIKGYAGFSGTLGHEFVGRVVESPDSALVGKRVVGEINAGCGRCYLCRTGDSRHCDLRTVLGIRGRDGAFAQFVSLPPRNLIEIPDSIKDEEAVFAEPLAAACNIVEQVEFREPERVAVIGDGKLVQLIVRVLSRTGTDVTVIGKHDDKLELVSRACARTIKVDEVGAQHHRRYDAVIEASGSPAGLPLAITLVKPRGKVVLKSTHHGETSFEMSAIVVNEVTIVGSRCGRFAPAVEMLAERAIDVEPFITARFPLEDGVAAFEKAASHNSIKVLLQVK